MHLKYDYQQQSGQGCLAVCLCYLFGLKPTTRREAAILMKGLFGQPLSYPVGLCQAFLANYAQNQRIKLVVGSKYYKEHLSGLNMQKRLYVTHKPINEAFLHKCPLPCIVLVDHWVLGGDAHVPHYVLLVSRHGSFVRVFDPWFGTSRLRRVGTIAKAERLLQKRLRIAPIIIQAADNE